PPLTLLSLFSPPTSPPPATYTLSLHDALPICIAGHHAGLADWSPSTGQSGLKDRLNKQSGSIAAAPKEVLAAERLSPPPLTLTGDRKSTRLNSSHVKISYAVFCLEKKNRIYHI